MTPATAEAAARRPAESAAEEAEALLEVSGLTVSFATEDAGAVPVVEDVSFSVGEGETVGLVGESGCGKSVTAMTIMRLIPTPPGRIDGGSVRFAGRDLLSLPDRELRRIRGDRIGMIFQEPMTSLNPVFTIGFQVTEVLRIHRGRRGRAARQEAVEVLERVGIGAAARRLDQYPHELSGGLRQRVMIAMALICRPDLLIADEPTTALDVTIQAQILDLISELQAELGMSMLVITHDLGVVAEVAERVVVMYAGRIVERAGVRALFARPAHPYTAGLLASIPRLGDRRAVLPTIPGVVPNPGARGPGCYFADRCAAASDRCREAIPPLAPVEDGHDVACWHPVS